jgi:hypothetical protein
MSDLLHKNEFHTIKLQMRVLIYSTVIFSVLEIVWLIIGGTTITDHLECIGNRFWIPNNTGGALFLLVRSMILIGPTVALWVVFFVCPLFQGKMPKLRQSEKMQPHMISIDDQDHHEDLMSDTHEGSIVYARPENEDGEGKRRPSQTPNLSYSV